MIRRIFTATAATALVLTMGVSAAEAGTWSKNDKVSATFINPKCKNGDTMYRIKLVNDTKKQRTFVFKTGWHDGPLAVVTISKRSEHIAKYRVADGRKHTLAVRVGDEIIAMKKGLVDVC